MLRCNYILYSCIVSYNPVVLANFKNIFFSVVLCTTQITSHSNNSMEIFKLHKSVRLYSSFLSPETLFHSTKRFCLYQRHGNNTLQVVLPALCSDFFFNLFNLFNFELNTSFGGVNFRL